MAYIATADRRERITVEDRFTVTAGPAAPADARHDLARRAAPYLDNGAHDDAILALSEVVTNVVRHGDVADGAPDHDLDRPRARPRAHHRGADDGRAIDAAGYEPTEDGGMGLAIVEKMAAAWGTDNGPPGRVWFDVSP